MEMGASLSGLSVTTLAAQSGLFEEAPAGPLTSRAACWQQLLPAIPPAVSGVREAEPLQIALGGWGPNPEKTQVLVSGSFRSEPRC